MPDEHGRDLNDLAEFWTTEFAVTRGVTARGFAYGDFRDRYGQECSIQESSLATEPAIWLGVDPCRMHLTVDQARGLAAMLTKFADTHELFDD